MVSEYRVFDGGSDDYEVRMTYYNDDGTVSHWDELPDFPRGSTVDELRANLNSMLAALDKPILDENGF